MTGLAISSSALASTFSTYSVTLGNSGSSIGYARTLFGSVSVTTFRGMGSIDRLWSNPTGSVDFQITFTTGTFVVPFKYLRVQATSGSFIVYPYASAVFTGSLGSSGGWGWGNGSSPAWTATSPSPRSVDIVW